MQLSMRIKVPDYKKKMKMWPFRAKDGKCAFNSEEEETWDIRKILLEWIGCDLFDLRGYLFLGAFA